MTAAKCSGGGGRQLKSPQLHFTRRLAKPTTTRHTLGPLFNMLPVVTLYRSVDVHNMGCCITNNRVAQCSSSAANAADDEVVVVLGGGGEGATDISSHNLHEEWTHLSVTRTTIVIVNPLFNLHLLLLRFLRDTLLFQLMWNSRLQTIVFLWFVIPFHPSLHPVNQICIVSDCACQESHTVCYVPPWEF